MLAVQQEIECGNCGACGHFVVCCWKKGATKTLPRANQERSQCGFKRPIKMIETGKYSAFKGPICNRDYHDAVSISRYFIASKFVSFPSHECKHGHSGEKE